VSALDAIEAAHRALVDSQPVPNVAKKAAASKPVDEPGGE
jgi:hypothetical protein